MNPTVTRRSFLQNMSVTAAGVSLSGCATMGGGHAKAERKRVPNVVVIFTDDQGYGDVGCYGAQGYETPNLDRMARQGIRFTDFYAAQAVCSASRAALLTGCYPNRIGIQGALGPNAKHGIHEEETTIAEMLKPLGYATAIYGKWHLGHLPKFLPTRHGFDDYFGLPYSNDMWPFHPEAPDNYPPLPLIEGEKTIAYNPDQSNLTTWYTERAVDFINKNKEKPFFLYVPHSMPHVPLFVSDKFKGKSQQGLYGDVMMEIDWSVGQILAALRENGLEENTLVVFATDNGPWLSYGDHAGSAGPLREGKGTSWDGGVRVPAIAWMPGTIPAGQVCTEPAMTIDLLPTIAKFTGASLPTRKIDGLDISALMRNERGAKSPHDAFYYYWDSTLQAVRSGDWSLHFPHPYRTLNGRQGGTGGIPVKYEQAQTETALFNLREDISQQRNVIDNHPDIVQRLTAFAERARADLGDGRIKGSGVREAGQA